MPLYSSDDQLATISASAIREACAFIPPELRDSAQFVHDGLSERLGRPVVVKIETVNPLGSFKGRGAWLAIAGLVADDVLSARREAVAASSGNFGMAVAYAARAHGVPAVVFAAASANPRKVERIRHLGAEVRLVGHDFDAAREASGAYAESTGGLLLVDAQEPRITIGAGTIAVELTDAIDRGELPPIAAAFIPVGNGALIVGIGSWLRHASPRTRVVGVQAEGAPSMTLSWRAGRPVETPAADTYAGGIATRVPVLEALAQMRHVVDDMVLVSDATLREAQAELFEALGITVEGSGAASWAAALGAPATEGAVLVVVSGANPELD